MVIKLDPKFCNQGEALLQDLAKKGRISKEIK